MNKRPSNIRSLDHHVALRFYTPCSPWSNCDSAGSRSVACRNCMIRRMLNSGTTVRLPPAPGPFATRKLPHLRGFGGPAQNWLRIVGQLGCESPVEGEEVEGWGFQGAKHESVASIRRTSPSCCRSLSRQGHPKIAHRFIGGTSVDEKAPAPTGATEIAALVEHFSSRMMPFREILSSLPGLNPLSRLSVPPLKRWAIVGSPCGTKSSKSPRRKSPGKPLELRVVPSCSGRSTLNAQRSTLNPQPSTLNPQPSTLNPQPMPPRQITTHRQRPAFHHENIRTSHAHHPVASARFPSQNRDQ